VMTLGSKLQFHSPLVHPFFSFPLSKIGLREPELGTGARVRGDGGVFGGEAIVLFAGTASFRWKSGLMGTNVFSGTEDVVVVVVVVTAESSVVFLVFFLSFFSSSFLLLRSSFFSLFSFSFSFSFSFLSFFFFAEGSITGCVDAAVAAVVDTVDIVVVVLVAGSEEDVTIVSVLVSSDL